MPRTSASTTDAVLAPLEDEPKSVLQSSKPVALAVSEPKSVLQSSEPAEGAVVVTVAASAATDEALLLLEPKSVSQSTDPFAVVVDVAEVSEPKSVLQSSEPTWDDALMASAEVVAVVVVSASAATAEPEPKSVLQSTEPDDDNVVSAPVAATAALEPEPKRVLQSNEPLPVDTSASEPMSVLQSTDPSCDNDAGVLVTGLNRLLQSTKPSVEVVLRALVVVVVSASAAMPELPLVVAVAVGAEVVATLALEPVGAVVAALPELEPSRTEKSTVDALVVVVLVVVALGAVMAVAVAVAGAAVVVALVVLLVVESVDVNEELTDLNSVSQSTDPVALLDTDKSKSVLQSTDPSWVVAVVVVVVSASEAVVLVPAELPKSVLQSKELMAAEAPEAEPMSDGKSLSQSLDAVVVDDKLVVVAAPP